MKLRFCGWLVTCGVLSAIACGRDEGSRYRNDAGDQGSGGRTPDGAGGAKPATGGMRNGSGGQPAASGGRPAASGGRPEGGAPPAMPDASFDGSVVVGSGGSPEGGGVRDAGPRKPDGAHAEDASAGRPGTGGTGTGGAGTGGTGGMSPSLDAGDAEDAGDAGCGPDAPEPWDVTSHLDAQGKLIAPSDGFQVATPAVELAPGAELFRCAHLALPTSGQFYVREWESQLQPGSYEFTLYRGDGDSQPSGTVTSPGCTAGFGGRSWLYTSNAPHTHLAFPSGVGMDVLQNQKVLVDMHLINYGVDTLHTSITLNARKANTRCRLQFAGAHVSFNVGIAIPPNGQQAVSGTCTPPAGAKYFYMTTKTRKRGMLATISRVAGDGTLLEELVRTTQWDAPNVRLWSTPPFLTFGAGDKFRYSCSYVNDRASVVTVGTSAENNEWCSAITYYFPAAPTTPACN